MTDMRVAIVCGTFRIGWGYQENIWAEELSRAGHAVRVFSASCPDGTASVGRGCDRTYEVRAVPTRRWPHAILLSSGLQAMIGEYAPELILWFGVEQFFGRDLVSYDKAPVVSFFSLNRGMHEFDWRKRGISFWQRLHAISWRLLRGPATREACRRSDLVVVAVPETCGILHLLFSAREREAIAPRILHVPLGFSPHVYRWNPATCRSAREQLGIAPADAVVIFSCRFSAARKEERNRNTLRAICSALECCPEFRAILVGFGSDLVSTRLQQLIRDSTVAGRVHCLLFAEQTRLNELYNAADIAVLPNASISCQAALGTGLTVCLADNGTMDHLARCPSQAVFFDPARPEELSSRLIDLADSMGSKPVEERYAEREILANASRWLGYDKLVASVLENAMAERLPEQDGDKVRRVPAMQHDGVNGVVI
jgi:glycosyltransferase involved in cell wall biosynthesis